MLRKKIVNTLDYEVIDFLLDSGADINIRDRKRNLTVIDYSAELGDFEIIKHIRKKLET